ncbi:Serine hydroxymethyltransferase [Streptomyces narbonensis]
MADVLAGERQRQAETLQLSAAENFASTAVLAALGSALANKYAEGYPGARHHGGCEYADAQAEILMGMCLGFLPHNMHPARIFMGDSGSMLIGLVLAAAAISITGQVDPDAMALYAQGERNATHAMLPVFIPLILPLTIIAIPMADLVLAIVHAAGHRVDAAQGADAADDGGERGGDLRGDLRDRWRRSSSSRRTPRRCRTPSRTAGRRCSSTRPRSREGPRARPP